MKKRLYIPGPNDASRVCPECHQVRTLAGFHPDRHPCRVCSNGRRSEREKRYRVAQSVLREVRREIDEAFVDEWVRDFVMRDPVCRQVLMGAGRA